jgi:hypothetical protein
LVISIRSATYHSMSLSAYSNAWIKILHRTSATSAPSI